MDCPYFIYSIYTLSLINVGLEFFPIPMLPSRGIGDWLFFDKRNRGSTLSKLTWNMSHRLHYHLTKSSDMQLQLNTHPKNLITTVNNISTWSCKIISFKDENILITSSSTHWNKGLLHLKFHLQVPLSHFSRICHQGHVYYRSANIHIGM